MAKPPTPKPVTIRFTARAYERVRKHLLKDQDEEFCFLFSHVVETPKRLIFLVDHVVTFTSDCYLRRGRTSIVLNPDAKNYLYSRFVESQYNGIINCHSHSFDTGAVYFSGIDGLDDLREFAWQYSELPRGKRSVGLSPRIHALSMVFGQKTLDARGYRPGDPPSLPAIEQVQVLGETLSILTPTSGNSPGLSDEQLATYDRQIRAFGEEGQRVLAGLRIGLVGAGGIGSILAEDLGRLGVRSSLTLVDADYLGQSNLNRWQGAHPNDVGQLKVKVLAKRLKAMFPHMRVTPIASRLTTSSALKALKGCDVLVGAIDNHLARFILNRLSVQYLIPYLDAATVITKRQEDKQMELWARMGVVVPGTTACLSCSQIKYYDSKEIALHLYDPQTRKRLIASGYIQDHPEVVSPAVMPLNMQASLMVLTELQNLVAGFHPLARCVVMDLLHSNNKTIRYDFDNFPEGPSPGCLSCTGFLGSGDSEPLPGIYMAPLKDKQTDKDISLPALSPEQTL
jgi:molybdopterin/thiamine biosynthesis adenylyltransferase